MVLKASGEVARFNELLPQYIAAPQLTRERLYLDTMEELYQNTNKVLRVMFRREQQRDLSAIR